MVGAWQPPPEPAGRDLPGKEPFLIPPLASKSAYYELGLVRALWHRAREALAEAETVVVCGYSLPLTDFATASLLENVHQRAVWRIADLDPAAPAGRLAQLVPGLSTAAELAGASAMTDLTANYSHHVSMRSTASVFERLKADSEQFKDEMRVVVRTSRSRLAVARRLSFDFAAWVVACGPLDRDNVMLEPDPVLDIGNEWLGLFPAAQCLVLHAQSRPEDSVVDPG